MTEIANCPFCNNNKCQVDSYGDTEIFLGTVWFVSCSACGYHSAEYNTKVGAVSMHNQVHDNQGFVRLLEIASLQLPDNWLLTLHIAPGERYVKLRDPAGTSLFFEGDIVSQIEQAIARTSKE